METLLWASLTQPQQQRALTRPAMTNPESIRSIVATVINQVRQDGDQALLTLTEKFDQVLLEHILVPEQQIHQAEMRLSDEIKAALQQAYANIACFHRAQKSTPLVVETMPGVVCELLTRPINRIGFYVPGGSAPLPSTVLMLGVPAQIAGCQKVVLCSPPPIADEILYAAKLCGINDIYNLGGAQAIAAMAYGTQTVNRVDKIFGPGNAFVTEAKRQVNHDHQGATMDMPAGPSEVLVIADQYADADFVAADLLSQAEHGPDSQVLLVTPSTDLAQRVTKSIKAQLKLVTRSTVVLKALKSSLIIIANDLDECVDISNQYAPEHLIVQTQDPRQLLPKIDNAGSIFLGPWSPESVGDYASGTNHVLPTYGYTRTYSSLGLADFSKRMTVQELTPDGLIALAPTVVAMANAEGLDAHRHAVTIRVEKLKLPS